MNATWNYIGVTSVAVAAAWMLAALGFDLATESFWTPPNPPLQPEIATQDVVESDAPASALLGRVFEEPVAIAETDSAPQRKADWVEVTDAVNMRSGGSSSEPVIKVQLEGNRLRVASRDGGWVEVFEPETDLTGWVYEKYLKPIDPESKQAGLIDAER